MICPHCAKNLLRKERPGNRCSHCGRRYALDPKTNPLGLHDLRVLRIAAGLTDEGRVRITPGQLWYALSRKRIREAKGAAGCAAGALAIGVLLTLGALIFQVAFLLYVSGTLLASWLAILVARRTGAVGGVPPIPRAHFRSVALVEWLQVYGSLPAGVVDDDGLALPERPKDAPAPNAVLVCPDPSIAAFLAADGLPERHGIALVRGAEQVRALLPSLPPRGPVLVLHDADAPGELLLRTLRAGHPERPVVDAGVALRTVRGLTKAVPYRDPDGKPSAEERRRLEALGEFTPEELKWLAHGWRFPLVGVPPVKLLAVVDRLAGQAARGGDAERRRATEAGFMTWPGAAPGGTDPQDVSR
ncbi:hypothetical protein [Streptomyces sp. NPDC096339]|uniref:hypothetical protein n=1 Tax=Streptomyces sp. NPDC096339 TaxID=3366086 RepID=UPI00380E1C17